MIWLVIGGILALLFGMYKAGPGSQSKNKEDLAQKQALLRKLLENFKKKR